MRKRGCFCGFNSLLAKFEYKHLLKILGTYWLIIQRKITVIGFMKILNRDRSYEKLTIFSIYRDFCI